MSNKLLLGRLFTAGKQGVTEARVLKDLVPIYARMLGSAQAPRAVEAALSRALQEQLVERQVLRSRPQWQLSELGREQAQSLFPGAGGVTWATLKKTWLIAHALGIEAELSAETVRALSRQSSLRMVLIARHCGLEVALPPAVKDIERDLLWHALRQGVSDSVFEWGKRRNPSVGVILAGLTATLGGVTPSAKKAEVYARWAAKLGGARNAAELHSALLTRLLSPPDGGAARASSPESHASDGGVLDPTNGNGVEGHPSEQPNRFATRVLAAARRSPSGRLDDSLVLINHVHRQYLRENPNERISLEEFKQQLMTEALDGALMLASADMPQVLDAADYQASRIERGASVYALLRT